MTEIIFRSDMKVDLVQHWGSDEMVARAARVSTNNDSVNQEKVEGLVGYLIRNGHFSPLAHAGATFRVEAPLFVRDQMSGHSVSGKQARSSTFRHPSAPCTTLGQVPTLTCA